MFFLGIFFRLLLLFSVPALSDDFYRFVWDGQLLIGGLNPYTILPSEFIHSLDYQQVINNSSIYQHLNSPNYYTVYPPLNQLIFGLSAWLSQGNLSANVVWLRVFILLAEVGTLFYLTPNPSPQERGVLTTSLSGSSTIRRVEVGLYAFNPLIIIELTGSLHFEAVVIFFLFLAFRKPSPSGRVGWGFSAFLFACAVGVKMLPLIFIPLVIKHLELKKGLIYAALVGIFTVIFFVPFLDKLLIEKLFSSVNLYFQKFEFNASIYYVVREVGFQLKGYNIIGTAGKVMAILTFLGILLISWRSKNLFTGALGILTLYLAMTTTVHPWYVSTLVAISIFTRFRYPIVWSYFVFLSYAMYQTNLYQENLWLVFVEYAVVLGVLIYEIQTHLKLIFEKTH